MSPPTDEELRLRSLLLRTCEVLRACVETADECHQSCWRGDKSGMLDEVEFSLLPDAEKALGHAISERRFDKNCNRLAPSGEA